MSDENGWIHESACGCVLHERHIKGMTWPLCKLTFYSRLCEMARCLYSSDGEGRFQQLRAHVEGILVCRSLESRIHDGSHTW